VRQRIQKVDELHADQFGYRSNHYIVTLRESWLGAPNYRGLEAVRAEIQVRTILMHAWANISHNLQYKAVEQVPEQFRRRIFQLSALFELSDQEFDRLRSEKQRFRRELADQAASGSGFDDSQPLNVDSLQAYLDYYFPGRESSSEHTLDLLAELQSIGISLADISGAYRAVEPFLERNEREEFAEDDEWKGGSWAQVGVVRHVLDLASDKYWAYRRGQLPDDDVETTEKRRQHIARQ
jgi:hypothetical protein